jgi:hypothetical protein
MQPQRGFAPIWIAPVFGTGVAGGVDARDPISVTNWLGMYGLFFYLVAAYANDISMRIFGAKAYLSWFGAAMMVAGSITIWVLFRGTRSLTGQFWIGFVVWMTLSSVFGMWPRNSLELLSGYVPRHVLVVFYTAAFVTTLRQCRSLMYANATAGLMTVLSCVLFGGIQAGGERFAVEGSAFFANANDLGLSLVLSIGFFLFMTAQRKISICIFGYAGFGAAAIYITKTASRGAFLALAVFLLICVVFSKYRLRIIVLGLAGIVFVATSSTVWKRITLVKVNVNATSLEGQSEEEIDAITSQMERQNLFRKAMKFTFTHALFGVGPAQFMNALYNDDVANHTHTAALGTHNSYTQISSECGIPGLFFYAGALVLSIRSSFRIFWMTRKYPEWAVESHMAFCLFAALVAYAVGSTFYHVAYGIALPALSGAAVATELSFQPAWESFQRERARQEAEQFPARMTAAVI